jgi:PAS domain S-box-containing protein
MTRGPRNVRLLVEIVLTIALAEMVVMLVLPYLAPGVSGLRVAIVDAILLSLIAGPVVIWRLAAASRRDPDPWQAVRTSSWFGRAVGAVVAIGVLLSAFAFAESRKSIRAEAMARFEKLAERTVSEIQRGINQPVFGLKGARGVYAASLQVSRNEFKAYVESRDLENEFPGALGFGFIQRVNRADLEPFIELERADNAPDFTVQSDAPPESGLADAKDLYVIKFVYPIDANREAWGYDVGSEPIRREAVERAVRTGEPAITGRISLLQDNMQQTGFLYLVPVYRNGEHPTTPDEREAALDGLVYAPIVLQRALADLDAFSMGQVNAEIYDGQTPQHGEPLFIGSTRRAATPDQKPSPSGFFGEYRLSIGGREWSIVIRSTDAFDATVDQHTPLVIGVVGLALTAMMAATLWGVGSSQRRAVHLAERMTRDLKRLSTIAERTSNAVIITDAQQRIEWVNDGFTRVTGYTLDEVRGRVPGHLLQTQSSDPIAIAHMRDSLAAGKGCEVELLNRSKDGREYIVAIEIQPLHDPSGTLQGFMAIESDITERVRAREHIERQEALLRETGEVAGVGGWMIDLPTQRHIWNEQTRRILEVDDQFVPTTKTMVGFFTEDVQAMVADALAQAAAKAEPFDLEVPLITANHRKIWVRIAGRAVCESGVPARLYGAIQDITNQRAANIALAVSEGRFRTLIEHAPAAIAMFDRDMRYIACSRQWLTEYGLLDPDIVGKSHYEVFPDVPMRWKRIHEQVLSGSIQHNARDPFVRADGHTQWLQWELRPWHTRDGAIAGMVMFTRDISAQVAQENVIREQAERLDLTLRSAQVGTWDWNVVTGSVAFNDLAQTMLGYEPGEWSPHLSAWEALVHPDDRDEVAKHLTEHLEGRSTDYRCEHRLRRKDGTWAWVLDVGRVIERADDGRAVRAMGVHMDITVAREAAEAVKAAQRAAEAANLAKSEFLANMSHEIRTPMTAIVGYADLLTDPQETNGHWRDHVETIKRNGEHLLTIINDILDLSKIEAGKMSVESIPMDPSQILADIESLMRVRAKAKGITLDIEYATPIPKLMTCDPVRFKQILVNLVGNAIKFTELGGVKMIASFDDGRSSTPPEGPSLIVSVVDTGLGMDQEQIDRLFLAFSQGDTSTTRRFGGTGLGLRISKSLAQMLGGDITLQSTRGAGSTFALRVPTGPVTTLVTPSTSPILAIDAPSTSLGASQPQNLLAGVRIFFAEDGPDNQRLISYHLRKAGANVRVFENGRLALEAMTTDGTTDGPLTDPPPCDLVLTDMQMPEIDGYMFARILRDKGWTRPIVALTAHAMSGDADRCAQAGCDRYATKPIERDALIAACRIDLPAADSRP